MIISNKPYALKTLICPIIFVLRRFKEIRAFKKNLSRQSRITAAYTVEIDKEVTVRFARPLVLKKF